MVYPDMVKSRTMPDISEYKTLKDAVADPRVPFTLHWLRILCQQGKVKSLKLGESTRGTWLVHMPSLLAYIAEMDRLGTKKHDPWD